MVRARWSMVALICTLTACGSSEEATTPPTAPPGEAPPAVAPAAAEGAPAVVPPVAAEPAAPAEPPTLEQRIAQSQPTLASPAAQTEGAVTVTAEVCTFDGPPSITDDSFSAIGQVAWASDGTLYMIDGDGRVRHYTIGAGEGCALTLDTTFGENGRMNLGEGLGGRPESIQADANGHVFVAASMRGTSRLTGNTVDYHCDTMGKLAVSPNGQNGLVAFGDAVPRRVTFTDTGCTVADWGAQEMFERVDTATFLDDTHVLVGGSSGPFSSPHVARVYSLDGRPQGAAFGDTSDSLQPGDHFCFVHGATEGSNDRLVVLDGNCRSFRIFDARHAFVAEINMMPLVGLTYPWFPGLTRARDGVAFLTAAQERANRVDVYDGFLFRVRGL